MGFLSGVLEDVSEKQPYSVGKTILIEIVTELKNNLSTGREGFKFIAQVADRVRGYNESVRKQNDYVKEKMKLLTSDMQTIKCEVGEILQDEETIEAGRIYRAVDNVNGKLEVGIRKTKDYLGYISSVPNILSDFNLRLKHKVENVNMSVKHEYDRLCDMSDKEKKDHNDMEVMIKTAHENLRKSVNDKVEYEITELIYRFKKSVTELQKKLQKINEGLAYYARNVYSWIEKADKIMQTALDLITKILEEVKHPACSDSNKDNLEKASKALRDKAYELFNAGTKANDAVQQYVKAALGQVKEMDGKLKEDLYKVKQAVSRQVEEIKTAIGKLYKVVESGSAEGADEHKKKVDTLIKHIKGRIGAIKGEGRNTNGLDFIRRGVITYVTGYNKKFETENLLKWVKKVVSLSDDAEGYVEMYLSGIHDELTDEHKYGQQTLAKITELLKTTITAELHKIAAKHTIDLNHNGNIDVNLKSIQKFLDKLNSGALQQLTKTIVDHIQQQLQRGGVVREIPTQTDDLSQAVRIVLHAVSTATDRLGEEINELVETCKLQNITHTMNSITVLFDKFDNALGLNAPLTFGAQSTNHAAAVDSAITEVTTELGRQLPPEGGNKAQSHVQLNKGTFTAYEKFVVQPIKEGELTGASDGSEGSLPAAIGEIKTEVEKALSEIGKFNGDSQQELAKVTSKIDALCSTIKQAAGDEEGLKKVLTEFKKEEISKGVDKKGLQALHKKITELRENNLVASIRDTEGLLILADMERTTFIDTLRKHIDYQVNVAQTALLRTARRNYVTSVKALLTAFADKVGQELKGLPGEIERDLTIGFKGLMKTLEDGSTHKDAKQQENIKLLSNLTDKSASSGSKPMTFTELAQSFYEFLIPLDTYIQKEIKNVHNEENEKKNPNPSNTETLYTGKFNAVVKGFESLLFHLIERKKYDCNVPNKLQNLIDTLTDLKPENFATPNSPVLDGVIEGLTKFADELDKAYISVYDSQICGELIKDYKQVSNLTGVVETYDLTDEGRNCAKVFLSILETLFHDLHVLRINCIPKSSQWHSKDVCLYDVEEDGSRVENRLGGWLRGRGFRVSQTKASHDGELRIQPHSTKNGIHGFMVNGSNDKYLFKNNDHKEQSRAVQKLIHHLHDYWKVCHLYIPHNPKTPSNINQMLQWLAGLRFRPDLNPLYMCFKESFPKPEGMEHLSYKEIKREDVKLSATTTITYQEMAAITLRDVCLQSYDILLAIQGHGHASGRYAVDFRTNVDNLDYPSNAASCFDMLVDVSYRVYDQLYFVFIQCQRTSEANSWRECWYGRHIGGSSWECNSMQCPNQRCPQKVDQIANQNANQNANQIARQTCDQHPKCGIKSPLQSFLEDGLQGFLPHSLTKIGCGEECSLGKHRGLPCKTPMGYAALGVEASHTKKGENLADILEGFCGKRNSSLTLLCAQFTCLLQKAPQSLDDMFSFFYNFLKDRTTNSEHRLAAFENAVRKANFGDATKRLDITCMFSDKSHGTNGTSTHIKGDLYCLYSCDYDSEPEITCGRYLQSCGINIWSTFSSKNSGRYLSWIVYLTETFYDLLKQLYEECCNNCNKPGTRCYGKICAEKCQVQMYYKSQASDSKVKTPATITHPNHDKQCKSIATCPFTRPTLSKYGFVLQSSHNLSGSHNVASKRTCQDLCETLKRVLSDEKDKNNVLAKLVHETIPEFLYQIRFPFMTLTLALWLLSFLYLLHIMVIRLDLLHIKSHLHSPSSHRIAAQSLLAAARVNKLNRVFYLQP
ncbi:hypothetical protein, conserved [Babesia bigemina]|uniref:Uncharacterized protein n=1 Tax=Babesia bigemina TaxID=5866 RepID=A0A061BR52_BABBI|nr:hypothetical protein, conserved [Babesia bigemina]CDR71928.1 hypothetical protein, conserved [Babesia bigemina]|eukprot:XP_012770870.1 hypothetical protein, conserved [Babesia bigemina]